MAKGLADKYSAKRIIFERSKRSKDETMTMDTNDYGKAGQQRLFQKGENNFVLIHKNGMAVAFQLDSNGKVDLVDRQKDVDLKSTGRSLIADGWTCVGPGLEYSGLFE